MRPALYAFGDGREPRHAGRGLRPQGRGRRVARALRQRTADARRVREPPRRDTRGTYARGSRARAAAAAEKGAARKAPGARRRRLRRAAREDGRSWIRTRDLRLIRAAL